VRAIGELAEANLWTLKVNENTDGLACVSGGLANGAVISS